MSKFGEQFGDFQFAEPAELEVSTEIDDAVRERAERVMKSVYPVEEGTNWDAILEIVLDEYKREHEILQDIIDGRFIDSATGEQLDMIAEMWQIERKRGEEDEHFRARIKTMFPRHTATGTIDEIKETSAVLLQTDSQRIDLDENFHIEPARFDLVVEETVFSSADVTIDEFEGLIQDIKPAGVRAFATIGSQFTHRSVTDYQNDVNDEDKGYDGYDPETLEIPGGEDAGWGEAGWGEGGWGTGTQSTDEPAQITDQSELLTVGGPYADRITQQYG